MRYSKAVFVSIVGYAALLNACSGSNEVSVDGGKGKAQVKSSMGGASVKIDSNTGSTGQTSGSATSSAGNSGSTNESDSEPIWENTNDESDDGFSQITLDEAEGDLDASEPSSVTSGDKSSAPASSAQTASTLKKSTFKFYQLESFVTTGKDSPVPYGVTSGNCRIGIDNQISGDGKVYVLSDMNCDLRNTIGLSQMANYPVRANRSVEAWFLDASRKVKNIRTLGTSVKPAIFSSVGCDAYGQVIVSQNNITAECGISAIRTVVKMVFKLTNSETHSFDTRGL